MKLYLDEMISPAVAVGLRQHGHDVAAAVERDALGASDPHQLAVVIRERRALVTYDAQDFAVVAKAMPAAGRDHWGIVLVSSLRIPPSEIGGLVQALDGLLGDNLDEDAFKNRTLFLPSALG